MAKIENVIVKRGDKLIRGGNKFETTKELINFVQSNPEIAKKMHEKGIIEIVEQKPKLKSNGDSKKQS